MQDIFQTFKIRFNSRNSFEIALGYRTMAVDIGYSDMILTYDKEFFRDRFAEFLTINDVTDFEVY